uniref:Uncharacterized protein n=1 Tax=Meloidogyne enterolobii TaxID=390850 RepID=A0A6V7YDE0_MELEN|nr:unnamed protein product [Meloidogyne enterolobii]
MLKILDRFFNSTVNLIILLKNLEKRAKIVGQENQQATSTSQSITSSEEPLKKYRGSLFGARRHAV